MKRMMLALAVIAFTLTSANVYAQNDPPKHQMTSDKPMTITGEIVDMGCYLGHGAKGADHKSCADKCIAGGMPMGLLTSDGKLYLLVQSHETADPFNSAKDMASEQVTITGPVFHRNGSMAIEVDQIKKVSDEKTPSKG